MTAGNGTSERVRQNLADFSTDRRVLVLSAMAVVVGGIGALAAYVLLSLINFITNIAFYQRLSNLPIVPEGHHLGYWVVAVPVVGALLIGLLARYGSEKIRGHGIPEALEAILLGRSRIEWKVALLKPLSPAISIGTGGPFGAEGPIIMTGGAFGSIFAQRFHLSAAERKTSLVLGLRQEWLRYSGRQLPPSCLPWSCCFSNGSRAVSFLWQSRRLLDMWCASRCWAADQFLELRVIQQ
jgi:H+/Cl- antiporter ClcA